MGAVRIVDYRAEWPEMFEVERARLVEVFRGLEVRIEHVGSTSVPGLPAKPIIDICVGLARLDDAVARRPGLELLGYEYVPTYEVQIPERRYFRRPVVHPRTHHLHCLVADGDEWRRHLGFRRRLRSDPELRDAYATLKRDLAGRFGRDRRGYTEAKSSFIEAALAWNS